MTMAVRCPLSRRGRAGLSQSTPHTDRVAENGLTDADLRDLARAYRWVRLQERKPTALLAKEFGLSIATVKRWVGRAVEAGYLTQAERTK